MGYLTSAQAIVATAAGFAVGPVISYFYKEKQRLWYFMEVSASSKSKIFDSNCDRFLYLKISSTRNIATYLFGFWFSRSFYWVLSSTNFMTASFYLVILNAITHSSCWYHIVVIRRCN